MSKDLLHEGQVGRSGMDSAPEPGPSSLTTYSVFRPCLTKLPRLSLNLGFFCLSTPTPKSWDNRLGPCSLSLCQDSLGFGLVFIISCMCGPCACSFHISQRRGVGFSGARVTDGAVTTGPSLQFPLCATGSGLNT